jgi:hypothetical protein
MVKAELQRGEKLFQIQLKLLIVTLEQKEIDSINWMITLSKLPFLMSEVRFRKLNLLKLPKTD